MKQLRIAGVAALLGVAVFIIVASASASASKPLFAKGGKFTNSASGNAVLKTASNAKVECTGTGGSGEVVPGTKEATDVTVTFTGCKASIGGKCTSSGKSAGEIVTNTLKATLGYKPGGGAGASEVLEALEPTGSSFAEFTCDSIVKVKVTGCVLGVLTPTNTEVGPSDSTTTFALKLKESSGAEEFREYLAEEGGSAISCHLTTTKLVGEGTEEAGIDDAETITPEVASYVEA